MKKSTKTLLKAACGIGAVGLVLILIGAGMGATWEDARREGKWAVTDRDLELFSEGTELISECEKYLDDAELKIKKLFNGGATDEL